MQEIAIVLGGTLPHIALINKLKERGYKVLLIDYLNNPPASQVADAHIIASTLDKEEVLRIAKESKAALVICSCVDQANVTAAYVSEKLGLPHAYGYETAICATDKTLMKEKFCRGGIPTASYCVIKNLEQIAHLKLSFPLIVKPADSNSSKGVRRVVNREELQSSLKEAFQISRNGKAVVEDFIEGIEIGADFIVIEGKVQYLTSKERIKISRRNGNVEQISGCIWPAPSITSLRDEILDAAQRIANEFGLVNTPLMMQGIIRNNQFYVIEFGARLGGGESFRLVNELSGVDYLELSIATWLGEQCVISSQNSEYVYGDTFIYSDTGIFSHVSGIEEAKSKGLIEYYNLYKSKGSSMSGELSSSDRLGVFVCKAKSLVELRENQKQVLDQLRVVDLQGNNILRRDLYEFY